MLLRSPLAETRVRSHGHHTPAFRAAASPTTVSRAYLGPRRTLHVRASAAPVVAEPRPALRVAERAKANPLAAACSAEGQAAREALLKDAVVLFICAGYPKKRFIYERARALGVKAVLIDSPNHWGKDVVGEVFDGFYPVDLSRDTETVFAEMLDIYQRIVEDFGGVDGICSFSDLAQPMAARLCAALGYPGNSVESVAKARNKDLTRLALRDAGIPTPGHMLITSPEQLETAAEVVGFPAVLKPVGGSESIGVVRVDGVDDLRAGYDKIQATMNNTCYKDGCLSTMDDEEETVGNANAALEFFTDIMMEGYMDGPEVDVDMVFSGGEPVYANVVDNWPTFEPWFQETGTNVPSMLPEAQQQELIHMATVSVKALGLTDGVQHVELKYTSSGARLIEVNPRMGGKCVRDENLLSTGVDMVVEHLICAVGLQAAPPVPATPLNYIGEYSINAPRSGILADHEFLKKWQDHPDVIYCRALAEVGKRLTGADDGFPSWICEVMVQRDNVADAVEFVKAIQQEVVSTVNIVSEDEYAASL